MGNNTASNTFWRTVMAGKVEKSIPNRLVGQGQTPSVPVKSVSFITSSPLLLSDEQKKLMIEGVIYGVKKKMTLRDIGNQAVLSAKCREILTIIVDLDKCEYIIIV